MSSFANLPNFAAMSSNRYALILGASSGFGKATALALAEEGVNIIGVHFDRAAGMKQVEELRAQLDGLGVRHLFFNVNAADATRRAEVLDAITEEFKGKDGATLVMLLHSLAFGTLRPFIADDPKDAIDEKSMNMTFDVMAAQLVYWTQDVVRRKLMGPGGRILGLTSAGSHRVLPMYGAVSAAKAGMEAMIRQLGLELAPYGITANSIQAGVTQTPALLKIPGSDVIIGNSIMRNPYHRTTETFDVGQVMKLLIKPEANWINGTVLVIDGGEDSIDLTWYKPE
jgi:NAD(P)-dependent dehydrogenase (short-subunit alcohol dehydrogenase family)